MTIKEVANWIVRVLKRICIEFSIPALVATIWYFLAASSTLNGWGLVFYVTEHLNQSMS